MADAIIGIERIRDAVIKSIDGLNIARLLLFGSYARGTANDTSDIDLALETNGRFSRLAREMILSGSCACNSARISLFAPIESSSMCEDATDSDLMSMRAMPSLPASVEEAQSAHNLYQPLSLVKVIEQP